MFPFYVAVILLGGYGKFDELRGPLPGLPRPLGSGGGPLQIAAVGFRKRPHQLPSTYG